MATYYFNPGFRAPKGANPEKVAQELSDASTADVLTAEKLVKYAQNPNTHVHGFFEWNDTIAGHQYRLHQARNLMRSIVVEREETSAQPIRAYTLVTVDPVEKQTGYMPTQLVVQKPDLLADATRRLKAEVSAAIRSVKELEELAAGKTKPAVVKARKHLDQAARAIEMI